jgi:hypothetical protein
VYDNDLCLLKEAHVKSFDLATGPNIQATKTLIKTSVAILAQAILAQNFRSHVGSNHFGSTRISYDSHGAWEEVFITVVCAFVFGPIARPNDLTNLFDYFSTRGRFASRTEICFNSESSLRCHTSRCDRRATAFNLWFRLSSYQHPYNDGDPIDINLKLACTEAGMGGGNLSRVANNKKILFGSEAHR